MIISLFSIFDPIANFKLNINWILMFFIIRIIPIPFWIIKSRTIILTDITIKKLHNELKSTFKINIIYKGSTIIMISCFLIIITSNITRNFPYTFCSSAHLSFSISLSIPIWLSVVIFQWVTLTKTIIAHLVPTGTPSILIPLIVIIEITRNLIRPIALAVRLTANLIAGHLLIALLGNMLNIKQPSWILISVTQILFIIFELIVALIQSYVFAVLITLYSREIT